MSAPFHEVVVGLQAGPGSRIQTTTPDGEEVEVQVPQQAQRGDVSSSASKGAASW